jgi:hypothetical protein
MSLFTSLHALELVTEQECGTQLSLSSYSRAADVRCFSGGCYGGCRYPCGPRRFGPSRPLRWTAEYLGSRPWGAQARTTPDTTGLTHMGIPSSPTDPLRPTRPAKPTNHSCVQTLTYACVRKL